MQIFWPALIAGVALVIGGIATYRYAAKIGPAAQQAQKNIASDGFAEKSSTPRNARIAGIALILVGTVGIVLSFLNLEW